MTADFDLLLAAFEVHSVEGIRAILDAGLDVSSPVDGKLPINCLIEMYFRSDRFPECLRLLVDRGATLDDPRVQAVLLNDPVALEAAVRRDPGLLRHTTNLRCTFTPLLAAGARTDVLLPGITWGKEFEWETTCFDVTPISYAQLGLLPQMQRTEHDSYANVRALLRAAG